LLVQTQGLELSVLEADTTGFPLLLEQWRLHDFGNCSISPRIALVHTQGLETELSVLEADTTGLQGKMAELQGLLGEQALEGETAVALPTEAGKVRGRTRVHKMWQGLLL